MSGPIETRVNRALALPGEPGSATADAGNDTSYDDVERLRATRGQPSEDTSYDRVEALRAERAADLGDHRYDAIEDLRAARADVSPTTDGDNLDSSVDPSHVMHHQ